MLTFKDKKSYETYLYKQKLRQTANGLGIMLLLFFGLTLIAALFLQMIIHGTNTGKYLFDDGVLYMLEGGVINTFLFFVVAMIYALLRRESFARLFPFEKTGVGMLVALCVIGLALSLMSNYAASLVTDIFGLFGVRNSGGDTLSDNTLPAVLIYYLTTAIMPALVEEFAFRGVVMGTLRKYSDAMALLVSSAVFALMHGNFVQIPFTFCCGLVFGYLVLKTNSLLPSIIVHFLNNALRVTYDVLVRYGILTDNQATFFYSAIIIIFGTATFVLIGWLARNKKGFFRLRPADAILPFREKLKTVASSPTIISFAAVMTLFSVYVLLRPVLNI